MLSFFPLLSTGYCTQDKLFCLNKEQIVHIYCLIRRSNIIDITEVQDFVYFNYMFLLPFNDWRPIFNNKKCLHTWALIVPICLEKYILLMYENTLVRHWNINFKKWMCKFECSLVIWPYDSLFSLCQVFQFCNYMDYPKKVQVVYQKKTLLQLLLNFENILYNM